jgi:hypothetical protein
MDKSANRNQNYGRGNKQAKGSAQTASSTGMIETMVDKVMDTNLDAKEFIGDLGKAIPKIAPKILKFSRENWKQIALVGGALAIVGIGAYTFFGGEKSLIEDQIKH